MESRGSLSKRFPRNSCWACYICIWRVKCSFPMRTGEKDEITLLCDCELLHFNLFSLQLKTKSVVILLWWFTQLLWYFFSHNVIHRKSLSAWTWSHLPVLSSFVLQLAHGANSIWTRIDSRLLFIMEYYVFIAIRSSVVNAEPNEILKIMGWWIYYYLVVIMITGNKGLFA